LTDHDGVITPIVRGASRLGLALAPAPAGDGPGSVAYAETFHGGGSFSGIG